MIEQDKEFEGKEDTSESEAEFESHWRKHKAKIQKHVDAAAKELQKAVDLVEYRMDLEEEFHKLVEEMRAKIREMLASGGLSKADAIELEAMINDRVSIVAWNNSSYDDDDDGWQSSQVCW